MNANDITFGIEIETTIPATALAGGVGPHGAGRPVVELRGVWLADRDPSIRSNGDRVACEFVSPVFKGVEGLRQLISDIQTIKQLGAQVNASCGLHIHVGFDKTNSDNSAKLATLVSNFEKAIFAATGTKNRERGRWCNGLSRYGTPQTAIQNSRSYRYHVANFATTKPTVEFRAFGASLNPQKIVAYVRMCVGLVERALDAKKMTNWTAKPVVETSPIHRGGEGATAVNRLFYQLGWTKGRQPKTFGDLTGEGLPAIVRSKNELIRLARKYDAQP